MKTIRKTIIWFISFYFSNYSSILREGKGGRERETWGVIEREKSNGISNFSTFLKFLTKESNFSKEMIIILKKMEYIFLLLFVLKEFQ